MAGFFGFFDYTKPGKGVSKNEPEKTGFALYFDILFRRFWKLISLNLFFIIASIPAILIAWIISTYFVTWSASMSQMDIEEMATSLSLLSAFFTVILLLICGSGPASAAMSYVIRKYVNDTHSWVWSDFVEHMKKNFKQGIAVYFINTLVISMTLFSFLFYSYNMQNMLAVVLRTLVLVVGAVFIMMQLYVYQLMAGFELKVKHIYKNALLLTLAKLPWNIISVLTAAFLVYGAFSLFMTSPLVGILIVFLLLFTIITFTEIFMTNNTVKKYILNPYLEEHKNDEEFFEADFNDTVM